MTWRHSAAAARGLLFSNNIILMSCSPTFFWVIKVKNTTFPRVKNEHHIANHHQSPPITHQSPPKYGANHLPITSEIDRIWPWHDSENLQKFSSDCARTCALSPWLSRRPSKVHALRRQYTITKTVGEECKRFWGWGSIWKIATNIYLFHCYANEGLHGLCI